MKKHIFGFALFSFIVGTTVFIYAMLNNVNAVEVAAPTYSARYSPATSCWKMKRHQNRVNSGSPLIKQAVFNLKSKQLKWELDTTDVTTPIALNFFVKDKNGMRYIDSKFVPTIAYRDGSVGATSSLEWLDNLDSYDNLYMTVEPVSSGFYKNKNFRPEFDSSHATAVLVY